MQVPSHGQWWSNLSTQLLQIPQWDALGGLQQEHVLQNLNFMKARLTVYTGDIVAPGLIFEYGICSSTMSSEVLIHFGIMPGSLSAA